MVQTDFRYQLEKGSKKHRCPQCEQKRFVKYIDDETGNYLEYDIGRCDREIECGYHKPPRQGDGLELASVLYRRYEPPKPIKASTISKGYLKRTQGNFERNVLINWLASLSGWDMQRAEAVAQKYKVGTSKDGWAIFWQVDEMGKIRAGKMMRYDTSGHRVKEGYSQDWVHSKLVRAGKLEGFNLVQCFFGLHLKSDNPIALVESEKTAIIASEYLPQFTWMATGQLNGINEEKMKVLKGKRVVLFPDVGAFEKWNDKAKELSHITDIQVSNLLESKASDKNSGYDLADYLIQFDLRDFSPHGWNPWTGEIFDKRGYPAEWDNTILN